MDHKEFKMTNKGACAYFLMMFSWLHFVLETWFASSRLELLITGVFSLLMFLAGIMLFDGFRGQEKEKQDPGIEASSSVSEPSAASAAARLIGSSILLIVIAQLLIRQLSMSLMRLSPGAVWGNLFFLAVYTPFIIISVVQVRKGFELKNGRSFSYRIDYLCLQVLMLYLLFKGIYYVLLWLQPMIGMPDYYISVFDLYWNIMPLGSVLIALILHLYLASPRSRNNLQKSGSSDPGILSAQARITGGWLLLLTGIFELSDRLIPDLIRVASMFGRYGGENLYPIGLSGYAPALILIAAAAAMIFLAMKQRSFL